MLFKKDELAVLVERDRADEKELAGLRKRLAALHPRWDELQAECERAESLANAFDGTYTKSVPETFWAARREKLDKETDAANAARDAIIGGLPAEIRALSNRIQTRRSTVVSDFISWIDETLVSKGYPLRKLPEDSPLAAELRTAREQLRQSQDMAEICRIMPDCVERVESTPNSMASLFNFRDRVGQWLSVAA